MEIHWVSMERSKAAEFSSACPFAIFRGMYFGVDPLALIS
jgi:hypothetical protein